MVELVVVGKLIWVDHDDRLNGLANLDEKNDIVCSLDCAEGDKRRYDAPTVLAIDTPYLRIRSVGTWLCRCSRQVG